MADSKGEPAWESAGAELVQFRFFLFAAMAVGVYLRWQQLPVQWLTDDEWHGVRKILSGASYAEILLSVGVADFSIPQTLLYKWIAATTGLNELGMRAPMLLAGVALVCGGGWWAWRNLGPAVACMFTALLAISPLLINFSRTARPYALTLLLVWIALLALERWRKQSDSRDSAVFGFAAVFACWLHMAVAPFVLAPFCAVAIERARDAWLTRNAASLRGTFVLGLGVALGVAVLGVLPMLLSRDVMAVRMGTDLPTLDTLVGVSHLWVGTAEPWLVLACFALVCCGVRPLFRTKPLLFGFALLGTAATLASIFLTRPAWSHNALVFGRYLLPLLPVLLLCLAVGVVECVRRLPFGKARWALLPVSASLMLVGSPTLELAARPNNFSLHSWYHFDFRPRHNPFHPLMEQFVMSPFWSRFAALEPESVRIAVAGHGLESFTLEDVRWQPVHRQLMWNAQITGYCGVPQYVGEAPPESGFRLRNAVDLRDPATLRDARIDYVVFKREGKWKGKGVLVPSVGPCIERFTAEYGAPDYEDEDLVAFRLSRGE